MQIGMNTFFAVIFVSGTYDACVMISAESSVTMNVSTTKGEAVRTVGDGRTLSSRERSVPVSLSIDSRNVDRRKNDNEDALTRKKPVNAIYYDNVSSMKTMNTNMDEKKEEEEDTKTTRNHSLSEHLYENVDNTKTMNGNANGKKQEGDAEKTKDHSSSASFNENIDNTKTMNETLDGKKHKNEDALMRRKRSVSASLTADAGNTTANSTAGEEDNDESDEDFAMRIRSASARLTSYLRSLPVSKERAIPWTCSSQSRCKIHLKTGIQVLSVLNVDDVQQTMKTSVFMFLAWQDQALVWNPDLYEGIEKVYVPPDSIWIPAVFVPNSMDLKDVMKESKVLQITSGGMINVSFPLLLETFCSMDLSFYPYDEQMCAIKLTSSALSYRWKMDETAQNGNLSALLELTSEWELKTVSTGMQTEYPEARVTLRRKTLFYTVCLVLPMVITSYMNTLVFLMPLQSGEKISFLVTVCVSTSVYTSFFSTMMPRGLNRLPITMKLLIWVVSESILVLLATLLVLRRFHAEVEATADTNRNLGKESSRHNDNEKDPSEPNVPSPAHITKMPANPESSIYPSKQIQIQPLQVMPKVGPDLAGRARMPSRSQRVAPWAPAGPQLPEKRGPRGLRGPRSHQLDWILFVISGLGNTIFLVCLFADVS